MHDGDSIEKKYIYDNIQTLILSSIKESQWFIIINVTKYTLKTTKE